MTELSVRLDKLRFLAEELQLAFTLASNAPDAWSSRLLARHILIRAYDVIAHARQIRKLVRTFGSDQKFHEAKESYASWFDEYFKTARHKLGAHVQDLDLGQRIELWNDIETSKIGTFVEGAAEIYGLLAPLNLPGYVPLTSPPAELADPVFLSTLAQFQHSAIPARAEYASDALAMTRPGTIAGSGNTPIHHRAAQLSLIARWIRWDRSTLDRFAAFPRVRRILLSRLVTDVVSFADCLITRPTASGALQTMVGFNDLMAAEAGGPSPALATFLSGYQFEPVLNRYRPVRDQIGGHLEIDPTQALADVFFALDSVDLADLHNFFEVMRDTFFAACGERVYLSLYRADGEALRGGVPVRLNSVVAYDPGARPDPDPELRRVHDWGSDDFKRILAGWYSEDTEKQETALDAFRQGFAQNRGQEFTVEHSTGSSSRWDRTYFTIAHGVLLQALIEAPSQTHAILLIDLLLSARRGYPNRATEVLIRYIEQGGPLSSAPIVIHALGMLAEWDVPRFMGPLAIAAKHGQPWPARREAILGHFRIFVRDEGLLRINNQTVFAQMGDEIEPLIVAVSSEEELELRLAMASSIWNPDLSLFVQRFKDDLDAVDERVLAIVSDELNAADRSGDIEVAERLVKNRDYVGLVLHLAFPTEGASHRALLELVRDGTIVPAQADIGARHLIGCLWLAGEKLGALSVASRLVQRSPGNALHELMRLDLLRRLPGRSEEVLAGLSRLRRDFQLSADEMAQVLELENAPELR
ncbi:hypothetical protein ACSV5G_20650 [Agrobacterium cavarae]|uniref:hypothetical protein n=1 Tax=Agrobacterium cavarae TaxID=2528239 RepID=UPI003FD11046